jgi:hypothetical protein
LKSKATGKTKISFAPCSASCATTAAKQSIAARLTVGSKPRIFSQAAPTALACSLALSHAASHG